MAAPVAAEYGVELRRTLTGFNEQIGLLSRAFEGQDGMAAMNALMERLRSAPPAAIAGRAVTDMVDYLPGNTGLLPSDVLEFRLEGGGKLIVRPSGTEPKLKVYLSARGESERAALEDLEQLGAAAESLMEGK